MTQTTLIANGTVVTADGEFAGDVLIDGETIAAVGRSRRARGDATVVDAAGCFVLPGLIDNHTHLSMPFMGTMSSDDYNTGTQAAAAGGVTCLVDFAIQQHPDDLQSTLDEWRGRADGAAHVDYGFHMAITNAERAGPRRDGRDVGGRRLLVQAVHGLQGRADGARRRARRVHGTRARPRRPDDGARRERRHRRPAGQARARAGRHLGDPPRADAARVRRGRGDRPRRAGSPSTSARPCSSSTSPAPLRPPRSRRRNSAVRPVTGETCFQYLTNTHRRSAPSRRRGLPLHLLAAAPRRLQPRAAVGLPPARRAREHLDRPLPVQRRAEVARAGRLQPRAQRPRADPAPSREAVGRGRRRRADHSLAARRPDEHDDRATVRSAGRRARSHRARTPTSSCSIQRRPGRTARRTRS